MELYQAVWLAIIQGLTEFLPISSSAHLILPSEVWGWSRSGPSLRCGCACGFIDRCD